MPEPPKDYSEHVDFPNHYAAKVTSINVERFSYVPQGGGWCDIPETLRLRCHQKVDRRSGGWPDVYGRLKLDGQAPTITAGFDSFTRGRYGHPLRDRPLTPREAARLQGFPDGFRFSGTRWDVRSQIGNAVPPPLAEAIGKAIVRSLMIEDGFRFSGTRWDVRSQIGNAVPPPLAEAIGKAIVRSLMIEDGFLEPKEDDLHPGMATGLKEAIDFVAGDGTAALSPS
jgi:site-specific DNA-cytosine methylase